MVDLRHHDEVAMPGDLYGEPPDRWRLLEDLRVEHHAGNAVLWSSGLCRLVDVVRIGPVGVSTSIEPSRTSMDPSESPMRV